MKEIFFAIRGTVFGGKVCPHKTDESLAVIKTAHPEVGPMLCYSANIDVVNTKKGGTYFLTFVKREDILMNLGEALAQAAQGNIQIGAKDEAVGHAVPVFQSLEDASKLDVDGDDEED